MSGSDLWSGPLVPGRSRGAPKGPLCETCGKGKGYMVGTGPWHHIKCLAPKFFGQPELLVDQPRLFAPDAPAGP